MACTYVSIAPDGPWFTPIFVWRLCKSCALPLWQSHSSQRTTCAFTKWYISLLSVWRNTADTITSYRHVTIHIHTYICSSHVLSRVQQVWSALVRDILQCKWKVRNRGDPHNVAVTKNGLQLATFRATSPETSQFFENLHSFTKLQNLRPTKICRNMHGTSLCGLH